MHNVKELREAAQALIDRWETPLWKDVPHTAGFIARLREALSQAPVPTSGAVEVARALDIMDRQWCGYNNAKAVIRTALRQPPAADGKLEA